MSGKPKPSKKNQMVENKKNKKEIVPTLCKNLSFSNKMQAPKLVKIVLNMGLG